MTRVCLWAPILLLCLLVLLGCSTAAEPTAVPPTLTPPVATVPPVAETVEGGVMVEGEPTDQAGVALKASLDAALQAIERLPGQTLASVNGAAITWEDYEPILRQSIAVLTQRYGVNWQDAAMQQRLRQVQNDALGQVVERWLMRQIASEQGLAVDKAEVDARVEEEKSKAMASGLYDDVADFLASNGFTEESFWQLVHDTMLYSDLMVAQEVETEAEQVLLAHILVGEEAQGRHVLDRLDAGEDFQDVAREVSMDPSTKDKGGEVGWITPEAVDAEVARIAFSLQPGEYSGLIGINQGYAIISVLDRQVRPLDARTLSQRRQEVVEAQIETARQAAEIEYLIDFLQQ